MPSILLYGSEVWCLKEDLLHRLRSFYHRCARTMCRINIAHTIRHHISSESLFGRLDIESIDTYYHRRLLRWAGHIARMPLNRAPRMFLTGWVANSRPIGCPQMTWAARSRKLFKETLSRPNFPSGANLLPIEASGGLFVGPNQRKDNSPKRVNTASGRG